jgi:hypothetical protein
MKERNMRHEEKIRKEKKTRKNKINPGKERQDKHKTKTNQKKKEKIRLHLTGSELNPLPLPTPYPCHISHTASPTATSPISNLFFSMLIWSDINPENTIKTLLNLSSFNPVNQPQHDKINFHC